MCSDRSSRREFLKRSALVSAAGAAAALPAVAEPPTAPKRRPNILMICADQFRADFVGAYGESPSTNTKNLDAMAKQGTLFCNAVSNQPLCFA
ncbi:MAG TPA: sulfatase-like hydrolase/transferase [Acidobacteriaceae bacterium]|nr:sulfatase-like hydrolase/transferase [Acidobacteriaceae bacterium]